LLSAPADSEAVFLERPNRFLGIAEIDGERERIHVPDPGRLRELLYPGAGILVRRAPPGSARKTAWTLMAARSPHGDGWILTNSLLHSRIARSLLSSPPLSPFGEATDIRAEVPVGGSRLDFRLQTPELGTVYVEVKGCTLVEEGEGLFPDAPTSRGRRHMEELAALARTGNSAAVLFLVFAPARLVGPNPATDRAFAESYWSAVRSGVTVHAHRVSYDGEKVVSAGPAGCLIGVDMPKGMGRIETSNSSH